MKHDISFQSIVLFLMVLILTGFSQVNAAIIDNSYLSNSYQNKSQCNSDVKKYNNLYPAFYRSGCFEGSEKKYFYNICDTNGCNIPKEYDKNIGKITPISPVYQIDKKTSDRIDMLIKNIGEKLQNKSDEDIKIWYGNFQDKLELLLEKYSDNSKNRNLLLALNDKIGDSIESGTFRPKERDRSSNDVIRNNPTDNISAGSQKKIDEKSAMKKLSNNNNKTNKVDITQAIQGLYKVTQEQYTYTDSYGNSQNDVCVAEYGLDWQEDNKKNADPYIMIYSKYKIKTLGLNSRVWNGTKFESQEKGKEYNIACIKNTYSDIVDQKYRITQGKYKGNILRQGDICKKEYGNNWKISKNEKALKAVIQYHTPKYTDYRSALRQSPVTVWNTLKQGSGNDCGGFNSSKNWNGRIYGLRNLYEDNPYSGQKGISRCSIDEKNNKNIQQYAQNFVCEIDTEDTEDITGIVQGIYKTTSNKYNYNDSFNSNTDVCKREYGRSWKINNSESVDANIMLFKQYGVATWMNTPGSETYVWNGKGETKQSGNDKNYVSCIEDNRYSYNENYKDILTSATPKEIDVYMRNLEKEILSKIKDTKDFVFIDDGFAITKKTYYGNQIYTQKGVCPSGYDIQRNKVIGSKKIQYNSYYQEILGKYVEQNKDRYYPKLPKSDKVIIPFRTWNNWDEEYVRKSSLDRIIEESRERTFETYSLNLGNPSRFMKGSNGVVVNNNYFYHGAGSGNGSVEGPSKKVGDKLPVLCVNNSKKLNTDFNDKNMNKYFKGLEPIPKELFINNKKDAGRGPIFFAYEQAKIMGFFNPTNYAGVKKIEYFLPKKTDSTLWFIKKKHY